MAATVTISRTEYERLKRAARSAFLAELDVALQSGLTGSWTEVQPRRRSRTKA